MIVNCMARTTCPQCDVVHEAMRNGAYLFVVAPSDFPGKKYRGKYAYEHTVVWWKNTGQIPPEGFVVHHKNENTHDNRFENFELKESVQHVSDHNRERKNPDVNVSCSFCKKEYQVPFRMFTWKTKKKKYDYFCSKSCQMRLNHLARSSAV